MIDPNYCVNEIAKLHLHWTDCDCLVRFDEMISDFFAQPHITWPDWIQVSLDLMLTSQTGQRLGVGVGCTGKNGEDFSKGSPMSRGRFKGYPLNRQRTAQMELCPVDPQD